jgi:rod shape-determining protein MreD
MTEHTQSLLSILGFAVRIALAYGIFLALLLLMMANWDLPFFAVLKPQLLLVLVFYWTLYRPGLMPPAIILLAGVFQDLLNPGVPLGLQAFSYLLIGGLLRPRRRAFMGQPFTVVWAVFVLAVVVDLILKVVMLSLFSELQLSFQVLFLNGFTTVLSFPILVSLLSLIGRILPPQRGMISS